MQIPSPTYLALLTILFLNACSDCERPVSEALAQIKCPKESSPAAERWGGVGECGWSVSCKLQSGERHGPFFVYTQGKLRIEGAFHSGQENGTWKYFNKKTQLTRSIDYDMGRKLQDESF